MKKVIAILLLGALSLISDTSFAQAPTHAAQNKMLKTSSTGLDTLVNGTDVIQKKDLKYLNYAVGVQATAIKIDGTASVVGILESTIDGTNWKPHFATIEHATASSKDSFIVTNTSGAQSKIFPIDPTTRRRGYRINWKSGGGTQRVSVFGSIFWAE